MTNDIPDWKLERLQLGELPRAELEMLRARVAESPELQRRLAALQDSDTATLEAYPPAEMAQRIRARAATQAPRRARLWSLPLVLAPALAAAAVLVAVTEDGNTPSGPARIESTRSKGLLPHLLVHRQRGEDIEVLADGAPARRGDVLQLSYVPAGRAHGVVLSLDGRGAVTLHHPTSEYAVTSLERDAEVVLPAAYELDDAPEFERFVLVTSDRPIDVQATLRAARALARSADARSAPLPLANSAEQVSVLIKKVN